LDDKLQEVRKNNQGDEDFSFFNKTDVTIEHIYKEKDRGNGKDNESLDYDSRSI
jgi:hypothetical protein